MVTTRAALEGARLRTCYIVASPTRLRAACRGQGGFGSLGFVVPARARAAVLFATTTSRMRCAGNPCSYGDDEGRFGRSALSSLGFRRPPAARVTGRPVLLQRCLCNGLSSAPRGQARGERRSLRFLAYQQWPWHMQVLLRSPSWLHAPTAHRRPWPIRGTPAHRLLRYRAALLGPARRGLGRGCR